MSWNYENKSGSEYLNEAEKSYLERFGDEIDGQAKEVAKNNDIDIETMKEEYFTFMNELENNDNEYLVHGAPLRCTMMHHGGNQTVRYSKGDMHSEPDENSIAKMSKLQVISETRAAFGEYTPATVKDAMGGLRDAEAGLNIVSFGNCKYMDEWDLDSLIEELSENASEEEVAEILKSAIEGGKGTRYCCMKLNPEWENLPASYDFATDSFEINISRVLSPCLAGADLWMDNIYQTFASPYHMFNGEQGINTMSMLFCQRGGIIIAEKSGQINTKEQAIEILKRYLQGDYTKEAELELVETALMYLAQISSYELPEYESQNKHDYNRYDMYILGWTEYYIDYYEKKYGVEKIYIVDPAYIKSQCYNESRIGIEESEIPIANAQRDIMQVLDMRNYTLYEYIDISCSQLYAPSSKTYNYAYLNGDYIWDINHTDTNDDGTKKEPPPDGSKYSKDKMERCGGLMASLFTPDKDGEKDSYVIGSDDVGTYYYQLERVTPIMSLAVGMDKMWDKLQESQGDYKAALMAYNGSDNRVEYANDIIGRVEDPEKLKNLD